MTREVWVLVAACAGLLAAGAHGGAAESHHAGGKPAYHLPEGDDARILTVSKADEWAAGGVSILTQAVAVKETGPKETIAHFGEVYSFSPSFIVFRKDQPTIVRILNLQPDDEHDFAVLGSKGRVLMDVAVPPLSETIYRVTFHQEGLFDLKCLVHQPVMSGQILVLPPEKN